MKYTRKQHLEMAYCLRVAKQLLAANAAEYTTDKTGLICFAVGKTGSVWANPVKQWIEAQLAGEPTLGAWLVRRHPELRTDALYGRNRTEWRNKLQATRHAWVDHMIHILES